MKKIKIDLTLLDDGANGIGYHDCAADLREPWYRAYGDPDGSVALNGNPEGFEFLARIFLKLARCPKDKGFHIHLPLAYADELEKWFGREEPMLTIGILEKGTS